MIQSSSGQIRLIPSAYTWSNTQYIRIGSGTHPMNYAYADTDSTTYAVVYTTRSNNNNDYYTYLHNFNFSSIDTDIPSEAIIDSFNVKLKAAGINIGTNYTPRLSNNTTQVTGTCSALTTTVQTLTFTGVTASFNTIKGYGNNFRVGVRLRRSSTGSASYAYIYGAEIAVSYTIPTAYEVSITNNTASVTVTPSHPIAYEGNNCTMTFGNVTDFATLQVLDGNTNITSYLINTSGSNYTYTIPSISSDHTITLNTVTAFNITASSEVPDIATVDPASGRVGQGNDYSINITKAEDRNSIRVYDGSTDVTSQLTVGYINESNTLSFVPSRYVSGNFTTTTQYPTSNGLTDATSTNYARFTVNSSITNGNCIYAFDTSSIPANATIVSISCSVKGYKTNNVITAGVQLYSGNTAKGSKTTFNGTTNATYNLTCGEWTVEELQDCQLKFTASSTSSSNYYLRFYGATLTIAYTYPVPSDVIKVYTITNVQAAHTITVRENTNYTLTASSSFSSATISPASKKIYQGEDYGALITVNDINSIIVKDNGTDVTSIVKSTYNNGNDRLYNLVSYEGGTMTVTNESNAYSSLTSNTYASLRNVSGNASQTYSYFKFDCSSIPNSAIITSVTCRVQICRSTTTTTMSNCNVSLQYNDSLKGSSASISSTTTSTNIVTITNGGTWTREELNDCILKCNCQVSGGTSVGLNLYGAELIVQYNYCGYSLTNVSAVHNIVVEEAPYKLISGDSSLTGAGFSNLPKKIYVNGESFIVSLSGISNRYSFRLSDNGNDVTSSVNVTNYQYTISNITADHELLITEAPKYAVSGTSNFTGKSITGTGNVYHGDSITVTLTNITNAKSFKLYDNNVDVTSSVNITNWQYTLTNVTTAHTLRIEEAPYYSISLTSNFDGKSLVPSSGFDPNKVYEGDSIVIEIQYNPDNLSFTLLDNNVDVTNDVDPDIYYYTLNNVQGNHTLVLNENPYYLISSEVGTLSGAGFTGIPKKYYYGSSYIVTITLTGISNSKSFKLYDNNVDVTANVNTSTYQYYLSNISANHILRIDEATKYTVTGTSNLSGAGFSGLGNVYQGDNITITLTGIVNTFSFKLYDNDTDVTSSVNTSNWRYIISNVQGAHILRIEEAPYYAVTATVTYSGASITGTSNKVYEGDSITVTLVGISDPDSFRLYDNGFLATDSVNSSYQYTISNINTDHELTLEEIPHYSVTEGNSTLSGATLTGLTNKVYEGSDVTVTIEGVSDPYSIKLTDNGVDVSDKLILPTGGAEQVSTYEVTTAPNASYGFNLNGNTGYYTSTNAGQALSAAVARVTFNLRVRSRITIKYINYAEGTYDYGIFGNIDSALGTTYTADSDVKYACSSSSDNTEDEQTLTYDIDSGEHFIDIKYRKDNYTDSNNDNLQFKIDSITDLDVYTPPVSDTQYIIENISENHVLVVSLQDTITVTTSSSYNGASLSPASSTVYKGEPIELTLTVSDISLISVRVTNSKTTMVTSIFTDNGNGTYTGILTVRENSTVTVIQKVTYTITCTDNATNGNITPTGTQSIDGGYDAEYVIESDYFNRIYLKDNNVIVNDLIERHELPEATNTFIPASFDSTNSTYSSVYNSNNPENGLTASNSSTRCCVYSNTGANAVSKLIYNFNCSSIPENATIDSVTCTAGAACYSSGQYFATRTLQLYSGDTAKGTATTITGNGGTNTSHTLNCGSWTRDELNNIKIVVYIARSTSNTTTDASFSFWGASLSITYHVDYYGYTIENVSAAHTLVLSDRPTYQITASSSTNKATILPASSTIYEANDITFEITTSDIHKIKLLDNNVDVTTDISIVSGNYVYEIENVIVAHTLLIKNKLTIFLKQLNAWTEYSKIYKKINNEWFEQDEMEGLFDINKIYILK